MMAANPPTVESFRMATSNRPTGIIIAWVVMTALAGVTVALRFYTRRFILRILGPEDWLILVSLVCGPPPFAAPEPS